MKDYRKEEEMNVQNKTSLRVCGLASCNNHVQTPTGDGSVPHRKGSFGGMLFCSHPCAKKWDKENNKVLPAMERCSRELGILLREGPKLSILDEASMQKISESISASAWPVIVDLPKTKDGSYCLQITPTKLTNVLSCIIGGDGNTELHLGKNATAQTGTLVAGICGAAIAHVYGGILRSIIPFTFCNNLEIEDSAILTMRLKTKRQGLSKISLEGCRLSDGKPLFKPSEVTLFHPN